ncbi:MAG: flagellar protein FliS [Pseudobdellovibrionaceae bacterium]
MPLDPYSRATAKYKDTYERNLTPHQILLELYKGMLRNLREAKISYACGDLGNMCRINQKNFLIISALKEHIDKTSHSKMSEGLDKFYSILFVRLAKVLESDNPYEEYERLGNFVQDVYEFWMRVGSCVSEQGSVSETQKLGVDNGTDIAG